MFSKSEKGSPRANFTVSVARFDGKSSSGQKMKCERQNRKRKKAKKPKIYGESKNIWGKANYMAELPIYGAIPKYMGNIGGFESPITS